MIVCLCEGISDKEIRSACKKGAKNVGAITEACGAGGNCGSCTRQIGDIISDVRSEQRSSMAKAAFRAALPVLILGG